MRCRHGLSRYEDDPAEVNLTPLIDVVFILLIFFLVTTTFTRDAGIDVQRPTAGSAQPTPNEALIVAIRANGELWMDGRAIDIRLLPAEVQRLQTDQPRAAVVIQADRATPVGLLVQAMDQLRQAGISDISLAAEQRTAD